MTGSLFAVDDDAGSLFIEGYTNLLSYEPGETIAFHLSSSEPQYTVEITRLGQEKKTVFKETRKNGAAHPVPENASSHGCKWPAAFELTVPDSWKSGYYNVRLSVRDRGGKFIQRNSRTAESKLFFIVRPKQPGTQSKILIQLSTNTYNAYNNWGGSSLYGYHGRANLQGHRVSFDRPLAGQFSNWEYPFIVWAESNGYQLDYAANSDLEHHPELLQHYKLVLSVGHDEYWSAPMRDHLENYIKQGGNVAFFSGNSVCWQVRSEDSGRALTCWKQWYNQDPVFTEGDQSLLSTLWSHHLVKRPENQLTGVGFLYGGYHKSHGQFMDGSGAYKVHRPTHWVFEKTGIKQGDEFGGKDTIVGYECDGCQFEMKDGLPVPTYKDGTPRTFQILASCPAKWAPGDSLWYDRFDKDRVGAAILGMYTNGGTVFTVGSTDWAHGLRGKDPIVQQMTKNILDRLSR
ncbi:MAG: hypothetical protein K0U86_11205 [Planctomycetes bacterium]|nr:hypothetical protein [Planctomycetota bacterium]MCH9725449.1 hypothetical protein [Planctomycetota bacterium]MCH9776546.1 hypothetical protein [Planctomycetota bacterium]MCH9789561.1 hypothetical protein [Planctomycetota bacterium]